MGISPIYIIYGILGITIVTSFMAWNNPLIMHKWIFHPYDIIRNKSFYRFLSSGFIHTDYVHLFLNMYVFYGFSSPVMRYFIFYTKTGIIGFLILYLGGIIVSSIPSYFKHKDNPSYRALGASGGVASILLAAIVINPNMSLYLMFIPIPLNALVLGVLYMIYSYWKSKNSSDNIGHDAHLTGAIYGIVIMALLHPTIMLEFIEQMKYFNPFPFL